MNLGSGESTTLVFGVRGGLTLEVCVARWWASLVDGSLQASLDFHSLRPSSEEVRKE